MKLTYALLRKQRTHNLRYIVRTLLMKLAPGSIDHEIISTVILLPSADSFKKGCCQLQAKVCAQITG